MQYDIDEFFNAVIQKNWWIICLLFIPIGFTNVLINNNLNIPNTFFVQCGIWLLSFICHLFASGFFINYIKNYSENPEYKPENIDFVLYLKLGAKAIAAFISTIIASIPMMLILALLIVVCIAFVAGSILNLALLPIIFTLVFIIGVFIFVGFIITIAYLICAMLLFIKTENMFAPFKMAAVFKMVFCDVICLLKFFLWLLLIMIPILLIDFSLTFISKFTIIFLPLFAFCYYSINMIISNMLAQLLRFTVQIMAEDGNFIKG